MALTAAVQTLSWLLGSTVLAAVAQPAPATAPAEAASVYPVAVRLTPEPSPSTIVDRTQVEAAGLTLYWQRHAPLNKGERLLRIDRIEENLYLITSQGRVLTLDAATGVHRWTAPLASEDMRILGPTHSPEAVFFATVLKTQAFDRVDGRRLLNTNEGPTPSSPLTCDGRDLYFGTVESRVVSMRLKDMLMNWQFAPNGLVTAKPILLGRNVIVVSQTGHIYSAEKKDKTQVWVAATTGPVQADPTTNGNHLYVASMDQSMWCFDMATGRTVWRTRMSYPLTDAPKATAAHVYLPIAQRGLFSLSPEDGKIAWHHEDAVGFVCETQSLVWLASARASLLGCDKATGQVRHEIAGDAPLWYANQDDDALWMANGDGQVVCLRPAGAGFLRYRTAREAMGRTTLPTTQPANRPADQDFVPEPPPKPPVDRLRHSDVLPPIGGNVPASQPAEAH